jgi:hypothetical protein
VPSYRLYRLDGAGKIVTAEWVEASDDQGALQEAQTRREGAQCELWDRNRLVARIPDPKQG